MKKFIAALGVVACALVMTTAAFAGEYTFSTTGLNYLDHSKVYGWGLSWSIPSDEEITGASFTFNSIANWAPETNDIIYTHLLDWTLPVLNNWVTLPDGVYSFPDIFKDPSDFFENKWVKPVFPGTHLFDFTDENDTASTPTASTFTYNFDAGQLASLTSYLSDGKFGFGLDPDCHYDLTGVDFKILTQGPTPPVPEPISSALFLLGGSAFGLKLFRKKGRKV